MALLQCSVVHNAPAIYSSSEQRLPARIPALGPPPMCPKGAWFYQELARHPILYHTTYAPRCTHSMWRALGETPQGISRINDSSQSALTLSDQTFNNNLGLYDLHPKNQVVPLWCAGCPVKTANSMSSSLAKATLLKAEPVVVPSDVQVENQSETYHNVVDGHAVNCLRNSVNNLLYGGCLYSSIYDAVDGDDQMSQMSLSQFIEQDSGIDSMRSTAVTPAPSGEEEEDYSMNGKQVMTPPPSVASDYDSDRMDTSVGSQKEEQTTGSSANRKDQVDTDSIPSSTSTEVVKPRPEEGLSGEYKVCVDHSYSILMSMDFQHSHSSLCSEKHKEKQSIKEPLDYFRSATPIDGMCDHQATKETDENFRSSTPIDVGELLPEYENRIQEIPNHIQQKQVFGADIDCKVESTNEVALQSHVISSAQSREELKPPGSGGDISSDDERLLICTSKDDLDDTEILFTDQAADTECSGENNKQDQHSPHSNQSIVSDGLIDWRDDQGFHSDTDDSYYDESLSRLSKEGKLPSFLEHSEFDDDDDEIEDGEGFNSTQPFSLQGSLLASENSKAGDKSIESSEEYIKHDLTDEDKAKCHKVNKDETDMERTTGSGPGRKLDMVQKLHDKEGGLTSVDTQKEKAENSSSTKIFTNDETSEIELKQHHTESGTDEGTAEGGNDLDMTPDLHQGDDGNKQATSIKLPHIEELLQKSPALVEGFKKSVENLQDRYPEKDGPAEVKVNENDNFLVCDTAVVIKDENAEHGKLDKDKVLPENIAVKLVSQTENILPGIKLSEEGIRDKGTVKEVDACKISTKNTKDFSEKSKETENNISSKRCDINQIPSKGDDKPSTKTQGNKESGENDNDQNCHKESLWQPWIKPPKGSVKKEQEFVQVPCSAESALIQKSVSQPQISMKNMAMRMMPTSVASIERKPTTVMASNSHSLYLSTKGRSQQHIALSQNPGNAKHPSAAGVVTAASVPPRGGKARQEVARKFLPSLEASATCTNLYKSGMLRFNQTGTPSRNLPSFAMFKQATPTQLQMWKAFNNPVITGQQQQHQQHHQYHQQKKMIHSTPSTANIAVVNPTGVHTAKHPHCRNEPTTASVNVPHSHMSGVPINCKAEKKPNTDKEVSKPSGIVDGECHGGVSNSGPNGSSSSSSDQQDVLMGKKPAKSLNPLAVHWMTEWLNKHMANPYPTTLEKKNLAKAGGITMAQVSSWFANKRARMGIKGKKIPYAVSKTSLHAESLIAEGTKNVQFSTGSNYPGCGGGGGPSRQFSGIVGKENTASALEKVREDVFTRIGKHKRGLSDVSNIGHSSSSDVVYHTAKKQKVHSEG